MTTKKEVVKKRTDLLHSAESKHQFYKGDKRIKSPRLCVVCGRPLTSLILNENKYSVIQNHTRCSLGGWIKVDICTDITSCYRTLKRKGELIENGNG